MRGVDDDDHELDTASELSDARVDRPAVSTGRVRGTCGSDRRLDGSAGRWGGDDTAAAGKCLTDADVAIAAATSAATADR